MKLIKDNFEEGHVVYLLNSSGKYTNQNAQQFYLNSCNQYSIVGVHPSACFM